MEWLQLSMLPHFLLQIRARTKVGYGDNSTVILVQLPVGKLELVVHQTHSCKDHAINASRTINISLNHARNDR